jgi:hypothetical protein
MNSTIKLEWHLKIRKGGEAGDFNCGIGWEEKQFKTEITAKEW